MKYYQIKFSDNGRRADGKEYDSMESADAKVAELIKKYADYKADDFIVELLVDLPSKLYVTNAPVAYDGFGTRTVIDQKDRRVVDVQDRHATWQLGRYNSGMYVMDLAGDHLNDYKSELTS